MTKKLREKWNEALQAVLPIIAIVLVLCFVIAPISSCSVSFWEQSFCLRE